MPQHWQEKSKSIHPQSKCGLSAQYNLKGNSEHGFTNSQASNRLFHSHSAGSVTEHLTVPLRKTVSLLYLCCLDHRWYPTPCITSPLLPSLAKTTWLWHVLLQSLSWLLAAWRAHSNYRRKYQALNSESHSVESQSHHFKRSAANLSKQYRPAVLLKCQNRGILLSWARAGLHGNSDSTAATLPGVDDLKLTFPWLSIFTHIKGPLSLCYKAPGRHMQWKMKTINLLLIPFLSGPKL